MMASANPTVADLIKTLEEDRLIRITIGTDSTPLQIQQSVLEGASEWFAKALKRDAFVEGKDGKLHFPEDDRESWEVLVYWMVRREFLACPLDKNDILLCCKCWALGHKYDIKRFQDQAMLKLMHCFRQQWLTFEEDKLNEILAVCPPKSKLGRVLAEQIVHGIHRGPNMDWKIVGKLDIGNFITELGEAQAKLIGDSLWEVKDQLEIGHGERLDLGTWWTEYMVGEKVDLQIGSVEDY